MVLCLIDKCAAELRFTSEGCGDACVSTINKRHAQRGITSEGRGDGTTHAKHARGLSPQFNFSRFTAYVPVTATLETLRLIPRPLLTRVTNAEVENPPKTVVAPLVL